MTREQRMRRAKEKRDMLLRFLASGEIWTIAEHAARLLGCRRPAAVSTLRALESEGLLVRATFLRPSRDDLPRSRMLAWGITAAGIELAWGECKPFHVMGKNVWHHLLTQLAHICALQAGWKWMCESKLILRESGRRVDQGKVPDAAALEYGRFRYAMEIQLSNKSDTALRNIASRHMEKLVTREYHGVIYLFVNENLRKNFARRLLAVLADLAQADKFSDVDSDMFEGTFAFFDFDWWAQTIAELARLRAMPD